MTQFLLNILPMFGTAFLIIFYIIQIGKTIKVKSVEGVSMLGWSMLNLALICMFVNALTIYIQFGTYGFLITETANVLLALIELGLIIKYKKK